METKSFHPKVPPRVMLIAGAVDVLGMVAGITLLLQMPEGEWLPGVALIVLTSTVSAIYVMRWYLRPPCPTCEQQLEREDGKTLCRACDVHWEPEG